MARLFRLLPPLDVTDPESFTAAAVALFANYSPDIQVAAVHRIALRSDRPTLKVMHQVLEEAYAPIRRQEERADKSRFLPAIPSRKRTPAEQARVDAQVANARRLLGIA